MVPPASVRLGVADRLSVEMSSSTMPVVTDEPLPPASTRLSKLPPLAETRLTVKLSAPSASASLMVAMLKLALLAPAGIVTVATPV